MKVITKENMQTTGSVMEMIKEEMRRKHIGVLIVISDQVDAVRDFAGEEYLTILAVNYSSSEISEKNDLSVMESENIKILPEYNILIKKDPYISMISKRNMFSSEILLNSIRMYGKSVRECISAATCAVEKGIIDNNTMTICVSIIDGFPNTIVVVKAKGLNDILRTEIEILCQIETTVDQDKKSQYRRNDEEN